MATRCSGGILQLAITFLQCYSMTYCPLLNYDFARDIQTREVARILKERRRWQRQRRDKFLGGWKSRVSEMPFPALLGKILQNWLKVRERYITCSKHNTQYIEYMYSLYIYLSCKGRVVSCGSHAYISLATSLIRTRFRRCLISFRVRVRLFGFSCRQNGTVVDTNSKFQFRQPVTSPQLGEFNFHYCQQFTMWHTVVLFCFRQRDYFEVPPTWEQLFINSKISRLKK